MIQLTCRLHVASGVEHELDKLSIVPGASLVVSTVSSKHCLDGTRTQVLSEITDWANAALPGSEAQRVLFLTGLAGSGKSTVACTIASRFHALGRLGASFAFSRRDHSRQINQLFPHIARQISGLGDAVKKVLAAVIPGFFLHDSSDLRIQFQQLIVDVLMKLTIMGSIIIVIDAIDEASDDTYAGSEKLGELISVITDLTSALPPNIRIIITSRPEGNILEAIKGCRMVAHKDLNQFPASNDIFMYVQDRLIQRPPQRLIGINEECSHQIAEKSQGLFYYAFLVCNEITNPKLTLPRNTYERIIGSGTNVQQTGLLDNLHMEVLKDHFSDDSLADFISVMSFILALQEPVLLSTLCSLWKAAGRDLEILESVLNRMRSLLDGVDDPTKTIQPSHTSFLDFVMDPMRSKTFCITTTAVQKAQKDLVFACLGIMVNQLHFNMCNLESSYLLNKQVADLAARINQCIFAECLYACCFWAAHLEHVEDTKELARDAAVQDALKVFLTEKLLFWLEVLSILGKMTIAIPAMSVVTAHLKVRSICSDQHHIY